MNIDTLTERRAKDREEMARLVEGLADRHGITNHREEGLGPREIWVKIETPEGLCLTVDFDGDGGQPNVFVLSWNMYKPGGIIADGFADDRNPYHFRKATDVCYGLRDLLSTLGRRFCSIQTGRAMEGRVA